MFVDRPSQNTKLELHTTQYLVVVVLATLHLGHVGGQMRIDEANVGLVQFQANANASLVTLRRACKVTVYCKKRCLHIEIQPNY